jgi:hypothetical protein
MTDLTAEELERALKVLACDEEGFRVYEDEHEEFRVLYTAARAHLASLRAPAADFDWKAQHQQHPHPATGPCDWCDAPAAGALTECEPGAHNERVARHGQCVRCGHDELVEDPAAGAPSAIAEALVRYMRKHRKKFMGVNQVEAFLRQAAPDPAGAPSEAVARLREHVDALYSTNALRARAMSPLLEELEAHVKGERQ